MKMKQGQGKPVDGDIKTGDRIQLTCGTYELTEIVSQGVLEDQFISWHHTDNHVEIPPETEGIALHEVYEGYMYRNVYVELGDEHMIILVPISNMERLKVETAIPPIQESRSRILPRFITNFSKRK